MYDIDIWQNISDLIYFEICSKMQMERQTIEWVNVAAKYKKHQPRIGLMPLKEHNPGIKWIYHSQTRFLVLCYKKTKTFVIKNSQIKSEPLFPIILYQSIIFPPFFPFHWYGRWWKMNGFQSIMDERGKPDLLFPFSMN